MAACGVSHQMVKLQLTMCLQQITARLADISSALYGTLRQTNDTQLKSKAKPDHTECGIRIKLVFS